MEEIWLDALGFEGIYQVSNLGQVKSMKFGRELLLKSRPTGPYGYLGMTLYKRIKHKHTKKYDRKIHLLVLEAFVGPRPEGLVGCHNDGDVTNNTLENLRWDTQANNIQDSVNQKTHKESRKTMCPRNHPYDGVWLNGHRYFTICRVINQAIREDKKKGLAFVEGSI